jgi:hypothetical protein
MTLSCLNVLDSALEQRPDRTNLFIQYDSTYPDSLSPIHASVKPLNEDGSELPGWQNWPERESCEFRSVLYFDYTPQALAAHPLPSEWEMHISPSGQRYYYNVKTKVSTWHHPILDPDPEHGFQTSHPAPRPGSKEEYEYFYHEHSEFARGIQK